MKCPVDLKGALLADDVRQENNGKFILIGVYNSNIVVSGFPFARTMYVVLLLGFHATGSCTIELRGVLPSGDTTFSVKGEISSQSQESSVLAPVGEIPMVFSQPTSFTVEARVNNGEWKAIGSWKIMKATPEEAAAS